jgi:hypothetical protein
VSDDDGREKCGSQSIRDRHVGLLLLNGGLSAVALMEGAAGEVQGVIHDTVTESRDLRLKEA